MASIQQSLNALIGAGTAAATMGAYMYRQSPTFQANQIKKATEGEAEAAFQRGITEKANERAEAYAMKKLENSPVIAPQKQNAVFQAQLRTEGAEIRERGAEQAFLTNPTLGNKQEWLDASIGRTKAMLEQKTLERQAERIKELRGIRKGLDERKETLKWQRNLGEALDTPGDHSHDRMKLATITRDVRFKEKNKGEFD